MKVIIAGSRTITDYETLKSAIKLSEFKIIEVVSGGAIGVDALGERFAKTNNILLTRILANWNFYGKAAGFIRNNEMSVYADALIAIWDGRSKGTKHIIESMKFLNKPTFVYKI